jgi:hypothetical protein
MQAVEHLTWIRERLEALVSQRWSIGLTDGDEAEYRDLCAAEAWFIQRSRGYALAAAA